MEIDVPSRRPAAAGALGLVLFAFVGIQVWGVLFPWMIGAGLYVRLALQEVLLFALPCALSLWVHPGQWGALRRRALSAGAAAALALAGVLAVPAFQTIAYLWDLALAALRLPFLVPDLSIPAAGGELALALLVVGCLPAFCEELLFRGLTLHALERLGTRRAILYSGLLFALMHGQLGALPVHLALGALLGAALVGYGSLWAPMILHGAFNGFSMLMAYLARGATGAEPIVPGVAEALGALLPVLAVCGGLSAALIWFPMRAAMRKHPPALFPRAGVGISLPARLLLALLLALFALQYVASVLLAATEGL